MITGKILKMRGWKEGRTIGLAKKAAHALAEIGRDENQILERLDAVLADPSKWTGDPICFEVASELISRERNNASKWADALRPTALPYQIWGAEGIDAAARTQMENALRLPVAVAGALMPDAHVGYGLPIGGVLATQGAVIPYAVGSDIACRMRLSIYDVSPHIIGQHRAKFEKSLTEQTRFGPGAKWGERERKEHQVLDDEDWRATRFLSGLRGKAIEQLGTSGSGNHFVEWGEFTLDDDAPQWGLKAGKYLSLLSHSGSRGVGFKIAGEFSRLARTLHPHLPDAVKHLAWLDMDSDAGREYWIGMELAGRFASACHNIIHQEVAKAAGFREVAAIENHHNFAWRETMADGSEAIVHRKGATPAGKGVLGIIPGSMGDAGYVVRGRGVTASLNSASHGAGRAMSRRAANDSITSGQVRKYLEARGVTLLGGGLDEAPMAYKDIEQVIAAQQDLVEVLGQFAPKIVMMAAEASDT